MKDQVEPNYSTNFRNILILSCGFMLLMAAWLTTAGIEQTILQSVQTDDPSFSGDGYISQAIVNIVFAFSTFVAPTIVSFVGVRTTLVVGTCFYTIFIASFLYPNSWLLYGSSVGIGFGAANVWIANGVYFTRNSTKETIGKYVGIYWAIMSMGQLLGNAFVFWKFQGMNHIDHDTRFLVISILICVASLASVTFIFLGKPPGHVKIVVGKPKKNICSSIMRPFCLLTNKHMLLLIPAAMYNGMEIAYFTAIYPTAVAFSEAFGGDTRKLLGFVGILVGVGSLLGGLVFGVLVDKFVKSKRTFIVITSCLAHCCSFLLMYLNLPDGAPLGPTLDVSWINPPSIPIAMICAFLLGIGDGCISPQMCAAIGVIWPEDPSSALAIYRFFLGATCAISYFIGTLTGLHIQLLIFLTVTLIGTLSFILNERLINQMDSQHSVKPALNQVTAPDLERKLSYDLSLKRE